VELFAPAANHEVTTMKNRQIIGGVPQNIMMGAILIRRCKECGENFNCKYIGCNSAREGQPCKCGVCLGATEANSRGCCDLRFKKRSI